MKKILLILISAFILSVSSASAKIKVGALYLDTAGFFGEIKVGIEAAGAAEGIDLTGANSQSDVAKESEFIDTLIATGYFIGDIFILNVSWCIALEAKSLYTLQNDSSLRLQTSLNSP